MERIWILFVTRQTEKVDLSLDILLIQFVLLNNRKCLFHWRLIGSYLASCILVRRHYFTWRLCCRWVSEEGKNARCDTACKWSLLLGGCRWLCQSRDEQLEYSRSEAGFAITSCSTRRGILENQSWYGPISDWHHWELLAVPFAVIPLVYSFIPTDGRDSLLSPKGLWNDNFWVPWHIWATSFPPADSRDTFYPSSVQKYSRSWKFSRLPSFPWYNRKIVFSVWKWQRAV